MKKIPAVVRVKELSHIYGLHEVEGYEVAPNFIVHQMIKPDGSRRGDWGITHIPTGFAVTDYHTSQHDAIYSFQLMRQKGRLEWEVECLQRLAEKIAHDNLR